MRLLEMTYEPCTTTDCNDGEVQLTDEVQNRTGTVEVCAGGVFGRVCNTDWDNTDAAVVCRELGLSPYGKVPGNHLVHIQTLASFPGPHAECCIPRVGLGKRLPNYNNV